MARGKTKSPAWAWLITGMLIGLFAAFLIYLNDTRGTQPSQSKSVRKPHTEQSSKEQGSARFDFYTILPDMEIPVPDIKEILPDSSARPQGESHGSTSTGNRDEKVQTPPQDGSYILQAGAFRSMEEADRLKARLALLGVIARIEEAEINGTDWYRVRIGPYNNMARLNEANNRLKENGINAMLLKLKG